MAALRKPDEVLYPELSYQIIGIAFRIYNALGYGYQEKYYQRAFTKEFTANGIHFRREDSVPLRYRDEPIGHYRLDFVVEEKIAVEIKVGTKFYPRDLRQLFAYLRAKKLRLGILLLFSPAGIRYRRLVL